MAIFKNYAVSNVGTTEVLVHQATDKSILIGIGISNTYGSVMPITIKLIKPNNTSYHIVKAKRIESGAYVDLMQGNKLVLQAGDYLKAYASDNSAFDIVLSVLEGVE